MHAILFYQNIGAHMYTYEFILLCPLLFTKDLEWFRTLINIRGEAHRGTRSVTKVIAPGVWVDFFLYLYFHSNFIFSVFYFLLLSFYSSFIFYFLFIYIFCFFYLFIYLFIFPFLFSIFLFPIFSYIFISVHICFFSINFPPK
jgi:hypothetical protein